MVGPPGPSGAEPAAQIGDRLHLDESMGCVTLSGAAVIWPAGTTLTRRLGIRLRHLVEGGDISSAARCAGPGGSFRFFTAAGTAVTVERSGS
jgi:hypothetical protein